MQELEDSRRALVEAVAGVTDEQAKQAPGPGKWSILEVVEHLAVSEKGMFSAFASACPVETSLRNPEKAAQLFERISGRAQVTEAPVRARPAGRFLSLEEALAAFLAARQETIEYARENERRLDFITVKHPLAGVISGCELLLIMAAHTLRHTKQIWEIRS